MSKDIDTSDLEALDYTDLVYLRDRGFNFPEDFEFPEDPSADAPEDYSGWKKAELVAEVERRNSQYEEPYLDTNATVAELRNMLQQDDARTEAEEG